MTQATRQVKVSFCEFPPMKGVRPLAIDLRPRANVVLVDARLRGKDALVKALVEYGERWAVAARPARLAGSAGDMRKEVTKMDEATRENMKRAAALAAKYEEQGDHEAAVRVFRKTLAEALLSTDRAQQNLRRDAALLAAEYPEQGDEETMMKICRETLLAAAEGRLDADAGTYLQAVRRKLERGH